MTRSATPGEPETEAGRRLDKSPDDGGYEGWLARRRGILAIEAEARAESSAEMERLRAALRDVKEWLIDYYPDSHILDMVVVALGDSR